MSTEPETETRFEEILARLEAIAARLERPDLPLDDAMNLYEEGVRLSKECTERLRTAELRIEELRPEPSLPTDDPETTP